MMEDNKNNQNEEEQLQPKQIQPASDETVQEEERTSSLKKKVISIVVSAVLVLALVACVTVIAQVLSKGYVSLGKYSLFRVVTGSMEPAIPVGSLLISQDVPIGDVQQGDVVNFRSREPGMFSVIITHRVIAIHQNAEGQIFLETKGDANQYPDGHLVDENYLIGKTVFYTKQDNPFAKILNFLTSSNGFLTCIVLPCLVIGVFTMRDCVKNLRDEMDAITKQLNEVEETVNNGLEQQLGEEAYQELCERLRGELLEELKQSAQTNTTEGSSGADCQ